MEKLFGLVAFALLAAFLGAIVGFVPEPDLAIVFAMVLALAAYDLYRSTFRGDGGER
jgi:uncharacterized membrane protein YfcA